MAPRLRDSSKQGQQSQCVSWSERRWMLVSPFEFLLCIQCGTPAYDGVPTLRVGLPQLALPADTSQTCPRRVVCGTRNPPCSQWGLTATPYWGQVGSDHCCLVITEDVPTASQGTVVLWMHGTASLYLLCAKISQVCVYVCVCALSIAFGGL